MTDLQKQRQGLLAITAQRPGAVLPSTLALAISGAMMASVSVAEESKGDSIELDKLKVEESVTPDTNPYATPGAPYLADKVSDPRRARPISETPQSITVLTATEIAESGRSDLREILDGQPGITLGTGENGNAFGDRYIIRGHEARSDMFVDGLRDPGMTIRESFAVEQVEISKGPSSSFAGRGTTGGAVNSATKRASTEYDFSKLSGGIGTDNHHRVTADINKALNDDVAIRVNVLHTQEDVPEREPADRERTGAAVSTTFEPTDELQIALDYYYLDAKDSPDLGTYLNTSGDGKPVSDIPAYVQNEDFLESEVNTTTLRVGYEFSPKTRLVNLTRYGTTENGYVVTGARGTTGYLTEDDANNEENGFATASMSTHQGWQEVEYFANQLNLISTQFIGEQVHEWVFSLEYADHSVKNGTYDYETTGVENCFTAGRRGVGEAFCISDASGNPATNLNGLLQREIIKDVFDSDWGLETISIAAMDTITLSEKWEVFAGLRYDLYDYSTLAYFDPDGRSGPAERELTEFADDGGYWNGHLGVVYQVNSNGNLYASYSSATNLNGGESDVGTSCGYGGICVDGSDPQIGDPEKTDSWELGTKWKLNDEKLLATAAVFRMTKDDVMESPTDNSYSTLGSLNTGKNEVEGVELGLAGNVTEKLSAQAGVTVMNAKVKDSVEPDNIGKTLANFADKSFSLHMKYQLTSQFALGGTATYESERYTGQPDTAANESMEVPDYWVFDTFATYKVNKDMSVRLNVANLTDEDYYLAAYRSGAFAYIGDRRNARLTLEYNL